MIDFQKVINYVIETQDKKTYKIFNSDFTCKTIYSADDKNDFSIYLISGDFIPFLFSNNKIYKVSSRALHDYYINHTHKGFLYDLQQQTKELIIKEYKKMEMISFNPKLKPIKTE